MKALDEYRTVAVRLKQLRLPRLPCAAEALLLPVITAQTFGANQWSVPNSKPVA